MDWEGTLVDFQWDLAGAVAETTALLKAKGIGESFSGMDYAAIYNTVQEKGPAWGYADGSLLALIDAVYDRYDLDAAARWTTCEDLAQTLQELKSYKLALVTNIGRRALEKLLLNNAALAGSFGLILTRDDLSYLKPHPQGLQKAMAWAGALPQETIHIGDSLSDLFAARNAGVKIGIVLGGQNTREALLQENPDLVLEKLSHLPAALAQRG